MLYAVCCCSLSIHHIYFVPTQESRKRYAREDAELAAKKAAAAAAAQRTPSSMPTDASKQAAAAPAAAPASSSGSRRESKTTAAEGSRTAEGKNTDSEFHLLFLHGRSLLTCQDPLCSLTMLPFLICAAEWRQKKGQWRLPTRWFLGPLCLLLRHKTAMRRTPLSVAKVLGVEPRDNNAGNDGVS